MLKKILICVPAVAVALATGVSVSASAASPAPVSAKVAASAPLAADRAVGCTADNPAVKQVTDILNKLVGSLVPPDPAKLQPLLGDLVNAILGLQKAACLPALPTSGAGAPVGAPGLPSLPAAGGLPSVPGLPAAPGLPVAKTAQGPTDCLLATVNTLAGTLGVLGSALAVPPNPTDLLGAVTKLVNAIKAINDNKCLPVPLPVPALPSLPSLPATPSLPSVPGVPSLPTGGLPTGGLPVQ